MRKLLNLARYWLGMAPKWNRCRKASCWFGSNAGIRIMNILSPKMDDAKFRERVAMSAARGVDTFHLFLVNKGDGEGAGYSALDTAAAAVMDRRIRRLRRDGYAVVLWCIADDSEAWAKSLDTDALMGVCEKRGWLRMASMVVIGLEVDEYWSRAQVAAHVAAVRRRWKGKVGVHMTSGRTDYADLADVLFYQTNPGKTAAQIAAETRKALGCGKPVFFFELSRHEDRALSQAALDAGASGVGNW